MTAPRPDPSGESSGWHLPAGSLARRLVLRLMPPIMFLVLLDLAGTWVITHKIDMAVWMLEDFFWLMVIGQLLLMVLCAVVIVKGVRSGLRSVQDLSQEIRQRSIDDMQPMAVQGLPAEIATLVTHINDLLLRLDASLAAQRRFIGHAAHQLRTP
ncbi:two-component sensor kinase [Bordetella trematum]|nr:two-component sensor kinase [Bordetella trematum]